MRKWWPGPSNNLSISVSPRLIEMARRWHQRNTQLEAQQHTVSEYDSEEF